RWDEAAGPRSNVVAGKLHNLNARSKPQGEGGQPLAHGWHTVFELSPVSSARSGHPRRMGRPAGGDELVARRLRSKRGWASPGGGLGQRARPPGDRKLVTRESAG